MGSSRARERQRIARACTRCRIKKVKCDGRYPCSCCKFQDTMCDYAERRYHRSRQVPVGYVEYLEKQREFLVQLVKEMWKSGNAALAVKAVKENNIGQEPTLHEIIEGCGLDMEIPEEYEQDSSDAKSLNRDEPEMSSAYDPGCPTPSFDFGFDMKFESTDSMLESYPSPLNSPNAYAASRTATTPLRWYSDRFENVDAMSVEMDSNSSTSLETGRLLEVNPSTVTLPNMEFAHTSTLLGVA